MWMVLGLSAIVFAALNVIWTIKNKNSKFID